MQWGLGLHSLWYSTKWDLKSDSNVIVLDLVLGNSVTANVSMSN